MTEQRRRGKYPDGMRERAVRLVFRPGGIAVRRIVSLPSLRMCQSVSPEAELQ